jgi:hypothetical protein
MQVLMHVTFWSAKGNDEFQIKLTVDKDFRRYLCLVQFSLHFAQFGLKNRGKTKTFLDHA